MAVALRMNAHPQSDSDRVGLTVQVTDGLAYHYIARKDAHMRIALSIGLVAMLVVVAISAFMPETDGVVVRHLFAAASVGEDETLTRTVPFVTVRNRTGSDRPAQLFGGERGQARAGFCDITRQPIRPLQAIARRSPVYIPEEKLDLAAIREEQPNDILQHLAATAKGLSPVVFVHGFFMSFERGCKRASIFQDAVGLEDRFLFFSWPSDGNIMTYTRDESDLYWSVDPLGELLEDMVRRFGKGNINLTAHSLGTRAAFLALIRMALEQTDTEPVVDQVVFLAPDIDAGIFKQHLPRIRSAARNITIYVSANDRPLALSSQVHGYPRLGEAGPHLNGIAGVEIIDLSDIAVRYPSGHLYHLYNRAIADDLSQLINEGKQAPDRSNLTQTGANYWLLRPTPPDSEEREDD